MEFLVDEYERPYVPTGNHPIEERRYTIGTDEISNMYDEIKQWIENRAPGGMAYGRPRLGKTYAVRYLKHALPYDFGINLPIFHYSCEQGKKQANDNKFYEDLLVAVGHGLPFSGKVPMKSDRLVKYFIEKAQSSGTNRILLFIDDAQSLLELEYKILMDIYNRLELAGVSLTTILVGQEELVHQRTAFLATKKAQIVGRFMVHEYKFSGLKTLSELQTLLDGYDLISEFPIGSGWSPTRYFFPQAYINGFRLKTYSEDLLNTFKEMRTEAGLHKNLEIPMQYLTLTIEYVLKKFGINGLDQDFLTKVNWIEAIRKSGYIENEVLMEML
ncbi:AAA family ATPase [Paenibacillus sedimenti]|uniref:ATP-binding protein n=1 Tax=Paenibacillus sedimenti TaxID=2770274 RepID=A0A926QNF4_9BACL|nr:AAA family ATPase [Paenibacillus sedimenti]MBD0384717.1 ATP-binding protein [Paenibacillus sedimenti]